MYLISPVTWVTVAGFVVVWAMLSVVIVVVAVVAAVAAAVNVLMYVVKRAGDVNQIKL